MAGQVIKSAGSTAVVSGSSPILLASKDASGSPSLIFATRNAKGQSGALFQSDFDDYLIEFINVVAANNDIGFLGTVSTDGGVTFSSTTYARGFQYGASSGASGGGGETNATSWNIGGNQTNVAAQGGLVGTIRLYSPMNASTYKQMMGYVGYGHTGVDWITLQMVWIWKTAAAINAMKFAFSAGNIVSGTIRFLGVPKS